MNCQIRPNFTPILPYVYPYNLRTDQDLEHSIWFQNDPDAFLILNIDHQNNLG